MILLFSYFFFNGAATTEIYTLSLHDALPILAEGELCEICADDRRDAAVVCVVEEPRDIVAVEKTQEFTGRSEEHTSELQSHHDLVCRLLLEKKKKTQYTSGRQQNWHGSDQ